MSWKYESSEEEERAAAVLREKGWHVSAPACPDCHGFGYVNRFEVWASGGNATTVTSDMTRKPCPRGCQAVSYYFYNTAGTLG